MLKFFRKIRQQLLSENQFTKYLLYAIGEILLVMIGILLALQVNTWNETKKNQKVVHNLYENILTSLEGDSIDLVNVIERVNRGLESKRLLMENSYDSLITKYSIEELGRIVFGTSAVGFSFFPRYGAYDQITNNGFLPLLRSEKVKNSLVELYERTYKRYEHIDAEVEKNRFQLYPIISGDLQTFTPVFQLRLPEGFDQEKFRTHFDALARQCRSSYAINWSSRRALENIQKEVSALQRLIREELSEMDH